MENSYWYIFPLAQNWILEKKYLISDYFRNSMKNFILTSDFYIPA